MKAPAEVTADTVTDRAIRQLRGEAEEHGDLRTAMICAQAVGGAGALEGAEPGTEAHALAAEERSQRWCREQCAKAITYARMVAS